MIEWQEQALVIEAIKFAEHDALVTLFTPSRGIIKAIVKGALSRRHRAGLEPLTLVEANFQARLPEHLGRATLEIITPYAAMVLADPIKLTAISSLATLMKAGLPEHDPHPELFGGVLRWLEMILHMPEAQQWLPHYIGLEIAMLEMLGFGLDLSRCAATGSHEDLQYVSPKSGRAVSRTAGAQYAAKLLPLPVFLREGTARPEWSELANGLKLTAYFIEYWLLAAIHRPLPPLRARLGDQVGRMAADRIPA